MKLLFTILLLAFSAEWCAGQTDTLSAPPLGAENTSALETGPAFWKNNVKVNLSSLLLRNYSFSYERSLTQKVSVVAGYRFMPRTTLEDMALARHISDKYIGNDDITSDLGNIATSSNAITGEVRLYGGKHPGARGFYVSVYGRYMNINIDYLDTYQSVANRTYQIPYQNDLRGFGGGLMFGAQWLLAKRVTLDWYILGAHYGRLTGDIVAVTDLSGMSQAEKEGLKEDIEHFVRLDGRVSVNATVSDNGVRAKGDGPFAGIRGFGLNIGFAF